MARMHSDHRSRTSHSYHHYASLKDIHDSHYNDKYQNNYQYDSYSRKRNSNEDKYYDSKKSRHKDYSDDEDIKISFNPNKPDSRRPVTSYYEPPYRRSKSDQNVCFSYEKSDKSRKSKSKHSSSSYPSLGLNLPETSNLDLLESEKLAINQSLNFPQLNFAAKSTLSDPNADLEIKKIQKI